MKGRNQSPTPWSLPNLWLVFLVTLAIGVALARPVALIGAITVTYLGEVNNAGAGATVKYGVDGFDLYGTAPRNRISRTWYGDNGAFKAGKRLTALPSYIAKIVVPPGVDTASAAGFPGYSLIDDPNRPEQQIRAGFETTHAPNARAIVPLVLIKLSSYATLPRNWYIGFMTDIHRGRVDDYPGVIQVTCGHSKAIVKTGRDGGHPDGGIDVYFFRVHNAKPSETITISAASWTQNPQGFRYNPSISGLLFTEKKPKTSTTVNPGHYQYNTPIYSNPPLGGRGRLIFHSSYPGGETIGSTGRINTWFTGASVSTRNLGTRAVSYLCDCAWKDNGYYEFSGGTATPAASFSRTATSRLATSELLRAIFSSNSLRTAATNGAAKDSVSFISVPHLGQIMVGSATSNLPEQIYQQYNPICHQWKSTADWCEY